MLAQDFNPARTTYMTMAQDFNPARTTYMTMAQDINPARTTYMTMDQDFNPARTTYMTMAAKSFAVIGPCSFSILPIRNQLNSLTRRDLYLGCDWTVLF